MDVYHISELLLQVFLFVVRNLPRRNAFDELELEPLPCRVRGGIVLIQFAEPSRLRTFAVEGACQAYL